MIRYSLKEGGVFLIGVGLFITLFVLPALAQNQQITIRVEGLSCPFCAYGLEKKLKALAGADNVRIDVDQGIVEIVTAEGQTIQETAIKKAVSDAGFTPKEITYQRGEPPPIRAKS